MITDQNTGPVRIGVISCGNNSNSNVYLANCRDLFTNLDIDAIADLDADRAQTQAMKYAITKVLTPEALMADPRVEVVRGCAQSHAAGGSLRGREVRYRGGEIRFYGETAGIPAPWVMSWRGWHQSGTGPAHNLGPYCLTALVSLLDPVRRVASATRISFPTRTVTSQPLASQMIEVTTPTYIVAALDFTSGPVASFAATYDVWAVRSVSSATIATHGRTSRSIPASRPTRAVSAWPTWRRRSGAATAPSGRRARSPTTSWS